MLTLRELFFFFFYLLDILGLQMIHIDLRIQPESGNIVHMWVIPTTMRLDEERSWE